MNDSTKRTYHGADVTCPHCAAPVAGARWTYRAVAEREAAAISKATGVPRSELLDGVKRATTRGRWALWACLIEKHGWPNARVARVCGRRDTTTVLLAMRVLARERREAVAA